MELTQLRNIIEGALLAAGQPLSLARLKSLFDEDDAPDTDAFKAALDAIAEGCEGRGFELKEVGSGWRLQVRADVAPWINRLWEEKPQKYSRALLETLALVAYRQPITRGDIEEIRGVAVSSHIIKTLSEREWVKVVGHRDVPGRPALYATTRQFLDYFNLKSLDELPSLGEIRDLNELNAALDLDGESSEDESVDRTDDDTNLPEDDNVPSESASPESALSDVSAESGDDAALSDTALSDEVLTDNADTGAANSEDDDPTTVDNSEAETDTRSEESSERHFSSESDARDPAPNSETDSSTL